jgi:hypothetical protein
MGDVGCGLWVVEELTPLSTRQVAYCPYPCITEPASEERDAWQDE